MTVNGVPYPLKPFFFNRNAPKDSRKWKMINYSDGPIYEGQVNDKGLRDGYVIHLTEKAQKVLEGSFKDGNLHGYARRV